MSSLELTQAEADRFLAMEKVRVNDDEWNFPQVGEKIMVPLLSKDRKESFGLDVSRKRIDLSKLTYQNRVRTNIILARLDLGARPHRNPDGAEVGSPHIHLYREGYADKWAFEVPSDLFGDLDDHYRALFDFMDYCKIVEQPIIEKGLFA